MKGICFFMKCYNLTFNSPYVKQGYDNSFGKQIVLWKYKVLGTT